MSPSLPLYLIVSSSLVNSPPAFHPPSAEAILRCWDGVFAEPSLSSVLRGCEARGWHSFTAVFDRRLEYPECGAPAGFSNAKDLGGRSVLEIAISSILGEVGDESRYVEYWCRDVTAPLSSSGGGDGSDNGLPRTLDVHRDVDEELCRKRRMPLRLGGDAKVGRQRCPSWGHVLYVNVEGEGRDAPTLVWEEEEEEKTGVSGGSNGGSSFHSPGAGPPRPVKRLWPVAAATNRLLRFRGDALHAVSYPSDTFLLSVGASGSGQVGSGGLKPISEADESEEKTQLPPSTGSRRVVLLFNAWDEPPLHPPVGEALTDAEVECARSILGEGGSDAAAAAVDHPVCRPAGEWRQTPVVRSPTSPLPPPSPSGCEDGRSVDNLLSATTRTVSARAPFSSDIRISAPLLGGPERRGCAEERLESLADEREVRAALRARDEVMAVALHPLPPSIVS